MFPDATYTLETVDTVYIQGPHEGGEVLEGARVVEGKQSSILMQCVRHGIRHLIFSTANRV